MHFTVMRGLSSDMKSPSRNSVHSPEMNNSDHVKNPKRWQPYHCLDAGKYSTCWASPRRQNVAAQAARGIENGQMHNSSPKQRVVCHLHEQRNTEAEEESAFSQNLKQGMVPTRCRLIKACISSGEITGETFFSLWNIVYKSGIFSVSGCTVYCAKFVVNKCHNWQPTAAISVSELFQATNVGFDS